MHHKEKIFQIFIAVFFSHLVLAQNSNTGNWFQYLGNNALSNKFTLHNEVQYRNYNFVGDLQQLLVRAGLGYNLTENNNNVLVGYAFIHSENYNNNEKVSNAEHRLYQQYVNKLSFGRVSLQNRYRSEERWLENNVYRFRLRYALIANVAITKPTLTDGAIYLSASNEIFINTSGNAFDRNRLYGGVGYIFNKKYKIELGYLSQRTATSERGQATIAFFSSLPFYNKD